MSQSEKPFSVNDRRLFTPDGRLREETEPEAPRPEPEAPRSEPAAPEGAPSPEGPADFGTFLLSLGTQASLLLSGRAEGGAASGPAAEALQGVRSIISILQMLKAKTEGHRTAEEDQILEGLLFELRMGYLERARGGRP